MRSALHSPAARAALCFFSFLSIPKNQANAEEGVVELKLLCPVTAVAAPAADGSVDLTIGRGSDDGVVAGGRGWILAKGKTTGVGDTAARGVVVSVDAASAHVRVVIEAGTDRAALVPGAQFEARILVPASVHQGQILQLMLLGISFLDNSRQPFTTLKELLAARDDRVERRVLNEMMISGRDVIELTTEMKEKVHHGKWQNKTITELLTESQIDDYRMFLRFVADYPGKYVAHVWKISETYVTWLVNDVPLSHADLQKELLALGNGPELTAAAKALKPDALSTLAEYSSLQIQKLPASRIAEAQAMVALLDQVIAARAEKSPAIAARVEMARADAVGRAPGKGLEVAAIDRRAAELYEKAGEIVDSLAARNDATLALIDAQRYDEALVSIADVKRVVARELPGAAAKGPTQAVMLSLREAYALRVEASIASKRGENRKVIDNLRPLVARYEEAGVDGARGLQIDLLGQIALAQRKLGSVEEASATYARIEKLAVELEDFARQDQAAFDIGDLCWSASRWEDARAAYARSATLAVKAKRPGDTARATAAEGQTLWKLGRHKEALARHDTALAIRRSVGDRSGTAWQLLEMGKIRRELGDREQARKLLDEALAIRQELKQRESEAEVRLALGDLHLALHQGDEAEKDYTGARLLYQELKSQPDEALALFGLARADVTRKQSERATEHLDEAIAIFDKLGDKRSLAAALMWQASLLSDRGERDKARAALVRARAQAPGDVGVQIDVLDGLSSIDTSDGKLVDAQREAGEALALAHKSKDVQRQLAALWSRLRCEVLNGDYDTALKTSEERITLARQIGDRPSLASALQQRAGQLESLGRLAEASKSAAEAMELAVQNADPVQRAWVFNEQASIAAAYGQQQERVRVLGLAIALAHEAGDRYAEGAMLANHSFALVELRDLDGGLQEGRHAEEVAGKTVTDEFRLKILGKRGEILWRKGLLADAEATLREALQLSRRSLPQEVPFLLITTARVVADRGDYKAALATVEEAVAIDRTRAGKPSGAISAQGILLARSGDDARALIALREATERAESGGGEVPWEPLFWLGTIQARSGDVTRALTSLGRAVKSIEGGESALDDDQARARYWSDKVGVYQLLIKLLLGKGDVEGALRYLERAKVAELNDVQRRAGPGSDPEALQAVELEAQESRFRHLLDDEMKKPRRNTERVNQLSDTLHGINKRRSTFIAKLARNTSLFDDYALRPLELEQIQKHLPAGILLVTPVLLDDRVVVFAVSSTGITYRESMVSSAEVTRLVEALRAEMHARRLNADIEAEGSDSPVKASLDRLLPISQKLYDIILRPVLEFDVPKALVVSPAGVLRYLPFAALHDGKQWLVERTTVLGMTTLDRENLAATKGPPRGTSLLAISNPDGTLPGAEREVAAIRKLFAHSSVLDGAAATMAAMRDQLRAPGYDILHIAAHGKLDALNPDQSRILLAGKPLTYDEIPDLNATRTRLVVLSACDTAVGTGGTGVEIAGLAYQFRRTDVHSVLATLWPVDDSTTAQLMTDFYKELKSGKDYPAALALAQRKMATGTSARYRHPVYWAPFLLLGAP